VFERPMTGHPAARARLANQSVVLEVDDSTREATGQMRRACTWKRIPHLTHGDDTCRYLFFDINHCFNQILFEARLSLLCQIAFLKGQVMSTFASKQFAQGTRMSILIQMTFACLFAGISCLSPSSARAQAHIEQGQEAEARDAAQNPVAAAISLPLQSNTYYGVGPYRRAENAFLLEPVVPFKLTQKVALITRTIVPVEVVPRLSPEEGVDYGLGNIHPGLYLTPAHPRKLVLAAGVILWLPTATDRVLGVNKWGGGPSFAGVYSHGHWLGGAILSNEFAGLHHSHVDELTLNPFLFYNMRHGWYFVSAPVMSADWTAQTSHRWDVPVGGGA
jgi:hypothetical protein